jgi:Flp pilus assembly protein TadG
VSPRRAPRRGSNVVEFALLAPVFVALLTGVVDVSWMFLMREAANSAARAGARAGAFGGTEDDARAAAGARWTRPGSRELRR